MFEYVEIGFRWFFGAQMVFWGLNGFFNWIKISPAGEVIEQFVKACIDTKFIMPTVKAFEVLFGLFLVIGFMIPVSLVCLSPLIFVITGLHAFHNPKPWGVLISYTFPFVVLLFLHKEPLLRLIH